MERWSVAWVCSFVNFLLLGVSRLSGLLYLAALGRYGVDRGRAARPFLLCYTVRNVAGPLIGYLGRKCEIRYLVACGCLLSAVGAGTCFLAEDITTVTVLWGGVYGIGFGLSTILLPEVLNQHFDRYIAAANGIALGGECVAGFILPVFFEFLLDSYGTSGSFLILSGLILHGIPAALLLKPPLKQTRGHSDDKKRSTTTFKDCGCLGDEDIENIRDKGGCSVCCSVTEPLTGSESTTKDCETLKTCSRDVLDGCEKYTCVSEEAEDFAVATDCWDINQSSVESIKEDSYLKYSNNRTSMSSVDKPNDKISLDCSISNQSNFQTMNSNSTMCRNTPYGFLHNCVNSNDTIPKSKNTHISNASNPTVSKTSEESSSKKHCNGNHTTNNLTTNSTPCNTKPQTSSPFTVFLDPPFLLILFTQSSMIFIFTTVMTIIVDFSRDVGLHAHQEVYVLMCLSVSDMLGRFGLGWVTDGHHLSNVAFSVLCYAGTGTLMVAMVFLEGFEMVMVVAFLIGLMLGGLLIVCPGIILDYIERDKVTMALASRFVLYAPMSLTQSTLIGFFRENLGSYNGLFYILAVHCFLCCVCLLSVPLAARCRDRRNKL